LRPLDLPKTVRIRSSIFWLLLAAIVCGGIARSVVATRLDDLTIDENYHIVAGASYVQRGDFRINPEHPPLVKLWVGSFVSLAGFHLDAFREFHDKADEREFVDDDFYLHNDPDLIQHAAHIAMWIFNGTLLVFFGVAVRRLFGPVAALGVLLFLVIDPTVAAHLPLVLTDLPIALLTGTAVVFAALAFRDWRWLDVLLGSAALGLALATKHSAPVFAIMIAFGGLLLATTGAPNSEARNTRPRRFGKLAVMLAGAMLILWSCYLFRFAESNEGKEVFNRPFASKVADLHSPVYRAVLTKFQVAHLLPRAYLWGFADTIRGGLEGRIEARLFFGRPYFGDPPKYFFPGVIAVKLPLGLTLLALLGIILFVVRRIPGEFRMPLLFISAVLAGFFLVLAFGATYGGIRHALPAVVLLAIFGGLSAHAAITSQLGLIRIVTALAFSGAAISAIPHLRPYEYYNELIGGSKNGYLNFNDEGVSMEFSRGKELVKYYREVVQPAGEIPYLFYYMPKPQRKRLGMDWVGNDMNRDAARLQSRQLTGFIFYETRFLGKRSFWDIPQLRAATPIAKFGSLAVFRGTFDVPAALASDRYDAALMKIYGEKPDLVEGEKLLRQSTALDPSAFFVHLEIGNVALARGSREESLAAYQAALAYAPLGLPESRRLIEEQIRRVNSEPLSKVGALRNPELE
jgi:hypothetical protein